MLRPQRLIRLAAAQASMARAIEARLAEHERIISSLLEARAEIELLSMCASAHQATFLPATLRRLMEVDARLAASQSEASALRRQLMAARGREKALDAKARLLRAREVRKAAETDALEAALRMAKDSGKPHVME